MIKNLRISVTKLSLLILISVTGFILFPPSYYNSIAAVVIKSELKPPRLIAHAGGSIYGFRLSNSLEALDNSYSNGFRFIELDFELTRDEKIVNLHDWSSTAKRYLLRSMGKIDYDKFNKAKKFMNLTLLNMDILYDWLLEHKDAYIITDVKSSLNLNVLSIIKNQYGSVQDQIIPQIYNSDEYEKVSEMGYKNIIFTLYLSDEDENNIASFIRNSTLFAVTMDENKVKNTSLVTSILEADVPIYVHTINDLYTYEQLRILGVHGIYTDHFTPSYWVED